MANQETSFQDSSIATAGTGRARQLWILVGVAVVLLALAVMFLMLDGGQSPAVDQGPVAPAVAPAGVDRQDLSGGVADEDESQATGLYPRISAIPWEYNHGR